MKRIKKQWIAKGFLIALLLVIIYGVVSIYMAPNIDAISEDMVIGDNHTYYVIENSRFNDCIYELDADGKVVNYVFYWNLSISNTIKDIYYSDALYYAEKKVENEQVYYYINRISNDWKSVEEVAKIEITNKERFEDFVIEDNQVVLLTIGSQSETLNIYTKSIDTEEENLSMSTVQSIENQTFIECQYSEGYLYLLTNTGELNIVSHKSTLIEVEKSYLIAGIRKADEGIVAYDSTNNSIVQIVSDEKDVIVVEQCTKLYSMTMRGTELLMAFYNDRDKLQLVIGEDANADAVTAIGASKEYSRKIIDTVYLGVILLLVSLYISIGFIRRRFYKASSFSGKLIIMIGALMLPIFIMTQILLLVVFNYQTANATTDLASLYANAIASSLSGLNYKNVDVSTYIDTDDYAETKAIFENTYELDEPAVNYVVYAGDDYENDVTDSAILVGEDVVYGSYVQDKFKSPVKEAIATAQETGTEVCGKYTIDKESAGFTVIPLDGTIVPNTFLVSIVSTENVDKEQTELLRGIFEIVVVSFLVVLILAYIWVRFVLRPVKVLSDNMEKVTKGDYNINDVIVRNDEFGKMWVSLKQMVKVLELKQKTDSTVVEKYYQFSHKDIEEYFGKNSITELQDKEQSLFTGLIGFAYISPMEKEEFSSMGQMISHLETLNSEGKRIILPASGDLSMVEWGFPEIPLEELGELYSNIYQYILHREEITFIDYDTFEFGVVQMTSRYYTYMKAQRMQFVEQFKEKFVDIGISIVISEEAMTKSSSNISTRYIGYLNNGIQKISLYELLYPEYRDDDKLKVNSAEKMKQALELFYATRFYEARELFYEIAKDNSNDGVVQWYVGKCNACMINSDEEDYALFK